MLETFNLFRIMILQSRLAYELVQKVSIRNGSNYLHSFRELGDQETIVACCHLK